MASAAYAVVTLGDAFVKKAMEIHELIFVAFYMNIATLVCLLLAAIYRKEFKLCFKTQALKLHILRSIILIAVTVCFLYAIANMTMAQTYTLYLTQPFILSILAHFLMKEYIGSHRIAAIITSFIGVLIVLRPGYVPIDLAALSALTCALLFASANLMVKFMPERESWMTFVFYSSGIHAVLFGLYLCATAGAPDLPESSSLLWIIGAGILYTFAIALFPMAMQRIDASLFGALEFSILAWGALFGYFFFAEIPDGWTIAGALVIVASGLYLVYRERKAHFKIKTEGIKNGT